MKEINIKSLGAVSGVGFDNTEVFKKAFSEENTKVIVPEGEYYTGPVTIKSNSELHIEKNAVLKFISDFNAYPPVYTRWEGVRCYAMHPMIYAENAENVVVSGEGTIDGCGKAWWKALRDKKARAAGPETEIEKRLASLNPGYENQPGGGGGRQSQFLRPAFVQFNTCKNVLLKGITVKNSPFWTIHPLFTTGLKIEGITIVNPADSPNTDAIDIDSCKDVEIRDCDISVGDDGIAMKSGNGEDGVAAAFPTENVVVENCTVRFAHGGAVIGSETAAGIRNVSFKNCSFVGTDRGIRVKTRRGRGGILENLSFSDITVDGCLCPIAFNMYYMCGADPDEWYFDLDEKEVTDVTPMIRDVKIDGVKARGCRSSAGFFVGLPEAKISGLSIRNCLFELDEKNVEDTDLSEMFVGIPHIDERSIRVRNAELAMENVSVTGASESVVYK